jgi:two-component system nitrogen regulation response regulator GlnG
LVESELFGHEAGAFTDARGRRIGRTEAANGGTLFLDEIGELPLSAQAKLLRFLEDQRIQRVGGNEEIALDVRIVAATNRDLATMVLAGAFREDLAWRLRVFTIHLPPLVQRMDDVPVLAKHFLSRSADRLGRNLQLTQDAIERLKTWHWPGNVRELRHTIEEAAVIATGGVISADLLSLPAPDPGANRGDLPRLMEERAKRLIDQTPGEVATRMQEELEHAMIRAALAKTEGNQLRAAELLGINRMTLKKRMDELGIRKG